MTTLDKNEIIKILSESQSFSEASEAIQAIINRRVTEAVNQLLSIKVSHPESYPIALARKADEIMEELNGTK